MDTGVLKLNSRVRVARSAIPNATSFIGYEGIVCRIAGNEIGVLLDNPQDKDFLKDLTMFLRRELEVVDAS